MDEIAKLFIELTKQYGPDTVQAIRSATIVQAWSSLQGNIIGLGFTGFCYYIGKHFWASTEAIDSDTNFGKVGAIILWIIAIITGTIAISCLTDPWLWVTFKNPDLWIAKKVFKL